MLTKQQKTKMLKQMDKDRHDLIPTVGRAWCNEHDCRPTTCFLLHNPTASNRRIKIKYGA